MIYPDRWGLFGAALGIALLEVALAGVVALAVSLPPSDKGSFAGLASILFILFLSIYLVFYTYRLVLWRPTLIVNEDGIIDNGTWIASGIGLVYWDEIYRISEYVYVNRRAPTATGRTRQRLSLVIEPRDVRAVMARQSLFARPFLHIYKFLLPGDAKISQTMLSVPLEELMAQIRKQYGTYIEKNRIIFSSRRQHNALMRKSLRVQTQRSVKRQSSRRAVGKR